MQEKIPITVLGLGNILLQDEGFGVHFVDHISRKYIFDGKVKVVDGGTLGYRLLDVVSSAEQLVIIDVIRIDDEPGSMYRFNRQEMELHMPPPTSAHEVEFLDVLYQAELMGELPEATFLCLVPERYGDMELEMTERMRMAFPGMEGLLLEELRRLGASWQEVR